MKRLILFTFFITLSFLLGTSSIVSAAPKNQAGKPTGGGTTSTPLGIDISWPQCGKKLPASPAFVVVGVNGGLATTPNNCLSDQLVYAKTKATGEIASQPKIQLYVNTANPAGLGTSSWPTSNVDPLGNISPNPHGNCDGSDSLACAWQYGWNRSVEDVNWWFKPAANKAGINNQTSAYLWWLDVETENSWKLSGITTDQESNVAVLEGMTEYFNSQNTEVGLYSTGPQWSLIVGSSVSAASNLTGLKNWRPGGASQSTAKQACSATALTAGGSIVMTQFVSRGIDYNHTC